MLFTVQTENILKTVNQGPKYTNKDVLVAVHKNRIMKEYIQESYQCIYCLLFLFGNQSFMLANRQSFNPGGKIIWSVLTKDFPSYI